MTGTPSRCSRPATAELSTPPLIATAIRSFSGMRPPRRRQLAGAVRRSRRPPRSARPPARPRSAARAKTGSNCAPGPRVRPIAVRTWEGSTAPLEHAAPLETANPRKSSAITVRLAADPVEVDVGGIRRARRAAAVDSGIRHAGENSRFEPVPQGPQALGLRGEVVREPLRGAAERHGARNVLRPGPAVALVVPAELNRSESACPSARTARLRPSAHRPCGRSSE